MEFLTDYGLFLAKAITVVVAIAVIIGLAANASHRPRKAHSGEIEITNLGEELDEVKDDLQKELLSEEEYKAAHKARRKKEKEEAKARKKQLKKAAKAEKKKSDTTASANEDSANKDASEESKEPIEKSVQSDESDKKAVDSKTVGASEKAENENNADDEKPRVFVLNFDGDVEASAVENLREEITAVIGVANEGDEVLLRLESPGGMVHAYGLAASQLSRLKQAKIHLVIAVDAVAASGGYMMACVGDKILSAPFAVVGSIGVVAELPNFHRLLKHNKVDYEQHTAGEFKRTLTMFAENTDPGREKFREELEQTHQLFKQFIRENRPGLDIDKVATGEHWYGTQALELNLIDGIQTSDDYILNAAKERQVFEVSYQVKKPLVERLNFSIQSAIQKAVLTIWQKSIQTNLFKS